MVRDALLRTAGVQDQRATGGKSRCMIRIFDAADNADTAGARTVRSSGPVEPTLPALWR
jgi:hypothetical protein